MAIGLTGGIATGKSTVSRMFRDLGAAVVDADRVAREVVQPGRRAWEQIVDEFGKEILLPSGEINRSALGEIVFADREARKTLERITHPAIRAEIRKQIEKAHEAGYPLVIADIPLLIENGLYQSYDKVILVYIDENLQKKRLMERDRLTEEQALKRMRAQMPIEEKRRYADYLIDNSGSLQHTQKQVERVYKELTGKGNER